MSSYTPRSYETARTIFGILEFIAWTAFVVGIVVAFTGASAGSYFSGRPVGVLGALPGIVLSLVGLIAAAIVQNCRAGVDTAQMTGEMLIIAREQMQLLRKHDGSARSMPASFPTATDTSKRPETNVAAAGTAASASFHRTGVAGVDDALPRGHREALPDDSDAMRVAEFAVPMNSREPMRVGTPREGTTVAAENPRLPTQIAADEELVETLPLAVDSGDSQAEKQLAVNPGAPPAAIESDILPNIANYARKVHQTPNMGMEEPGSETAVENEVDPDAQRDKLDNLGEDSTSTSPPVRHVFVPRPQRQLPPEIVKHRGVPITLTSDGAFVRGERFDSLEAAQNRINRMRIGDLTRD